MRNPVGLLDETFGIQTTWKNGIPYFSMVGRVLAEELQGNHGAYAEVSTLMREVEANKNKYNQTDDRILIKSPKQLLVFYPDEIRRLALKDEALYIKALKRGKSELRYQANERRQNNG